MPASFSPYPSGLLHRGETLTVSATVAGTLRLFRNCGGKRTALESRPLAPGGRWEWTAPDCGQYLAEFTDATGEVSRRPLAFVAEDWAVCQITVGAFTSEDFADLIHEAGLAADYYVALRGSSEDKPFSAGDPRWREYERLHGDAIHPHAMADAIGEISPALAHEDPNWDTLPLDAILDRLRALQSWWSARGYEPLDRLATYTPCNRLVEACRAAGIRVLHSLCPEQNWSDGEWAINHWGMPTAPYWIASDDFRKAGARDPHGVLGITMNHYQVLLPHLTRWGDFVLSPSHFTRWIRAADSGPESMRFLQFLRDTVRGGTSLGRSPFFFVAGFEFGRTFGTANMTAYNRAGLRRLIELAATERLVFATSTDVRAYHDRHVPAFAERAFRQRDNWVGVTVNGKPGQAGDSVVIERSAYKALIREGDSLPYFVYDYTLGWNFAANDINAPHDFAKDCARELAVTRFSEDKIVLAAPASLTRAVPLAFWDAELPDAEDFRRLPLAPLDDGRTVTVLEIPAGWSGQAELRLRSAKAARVTRRDGLWVMQTFGEGSETHTYLHLSAALRHGVKLRVRLTEPALVDDARRPIGRWEAVEHELEFGPLQAWYRFRGCSLAAISPQEDAASVLRASWALLDEETAKIEARREIEALEETAWKHPALRGTRPLLSVHCGGSLHTGTRSRAGAHDVLFVHAPGLTASEHGDGAISFGPGKSFWYHPRGLHFRVTGLREAESVSSSNWTALLHTFDPLGLNVVYRVSVGAARRPAGIWHVPESPLDPAAFFPVELTPDDLDHRGLIRFGLHAAQPPLVHWWQDGGFIAALHALWIGKKSPS